MLMEPAGLEEHISCSFPQEVRALGGVRRGVGRGELADPVQGEEAARTAAQEGATGGT